MNTQPGGVNEEKFGGEFKDRALGVLDEILRGYEGSLDVLEAKRPHQLAPLQEQFDFSNQAAELNGAIGAITRTVTIISELE